MGFDSDETQTDDGKSSDFEMCLRNWSFVGTSITKSKFLKEEVGLISPQNEFQQNSLLHSQFLIQLFGAVPRDHPTLLEKQSQMTQTGPAKYDLPQSGFQSVSLLHSQFLFSHVCRLCVDLLRFGNQSHDSIQCTGPKRVFPTKRISPKFVSSLPIFIQSFVAVSSSPAFIETNRKRLKQVPREGSNGIPQTKFHPNSLVLSQNFFFRGTAYDHPVVVAHLVQQWELFFDFLSNFDWKQNPYEWVILRKLFLWQHKFNWFRDHF